MQWNWRSCWKWYQGNSHGRRHRSSHQHSVSRQSIHSLNTNHQRQYSATGLLLRLAGDAVVKIQVGNQTKHFKTICGTRELSITVWTWVDLGIFWKWIARTTNTHYHPVNWRPTYICAAAEIIGQLCWHHFQTKSQVGEGITAYLTLQTWSQAKVLKPCAILHISEHKLKLHWVKWK